jgi:hypothetical protein
MWTHEGMGAEDWDRSGEALAGLADDEIVHTDNDVRWLSPDDDIDDRVGEAMGGMRRSDDL